MAGNDGYTVEKRHVSTITPEEFEREYINRCQPIVLQGSMDDWEAYGKWTVEFFREHYGDAEVPVDMGGFRGQRKTMKLRDYVNSFDEYVLDAEANGSAVPYLRVWDFTDDFPELRQCFDTEEYFTDAFRKLPARTRPPFTWLFMGPKGTVSKLHVDIWYTDAWLCNLQGRKKFTVFHPSHRRYLEAADNCWVDLDKPDREQFPDFDRAIPVEFILEAGEMLYVPRKWPHAATALEPSLSLSANFLSKVNKRHVLPTLAKYLSRRSKCEMLLNRELRGSDNLMKFCCHGGRIPVEAAKAIMGAAFQKLLTADDDDDNDDGNDDDHDDSNKEQEQEEEEEAMQKNEAAATDDGHGDDFIVGK